MLFPLVFKSLKCLNLKLYKHIQDLEFYSNSVFVDCWLPAFLDSVFPKKGILEVFLIF